MFGGKDTVAVTQPLIVSGNTATLTSEVNGYRVTVTVEPVGNKPLDERTATLALTAAIPQFPQKTTSGEW